MVSYSLSAKNKKQNTFTNTVTYSQEKKGKSPYSVSNKERTSSHSPSSLHSISNISGTGHKISSKSCGYSFPKQSYCPFGGACHTCPAMMQTKLKINTPGDKYEKEADRVANLVFRDNTTQIQRKDNSSGVNLKKISNSNLESNSGPANAKDALMSSITDQGENLPDPSLRFFNSKNSGQSLS